jgi:hypothetical protein
MKSQVTVDIDIDSKGLHICGHRCRYLHEPHYAFGDGNIWWCTLLLHASVAESAKDSGAIALKRVSKDVDWPRRSRQCLRRER